MEAENKLYADMHGESGGPPAQGTAQYTPAPEQPGSWGGPNLPSQGYPPYVPPTAGMTYYAPPSASENRPPLPPSGHRQQTVVVTSTTQQPVDFRDAETYSGAIVYACFVLWCCNIPFGLIGFSLAWHAQLTALSDPEGARKYGMASYTVTTVGILVTIVVIAIVLGVTLSINSCLYYREGICYTRKSYGYSASWCSNVGGYYNDGSCYYQ